MSPDPSEFKSEESLDESNKDSLDSTSSLLSEIDPKTDPLIYAQNLQTQVGTIGFDWKNPQQALPKLYEELEEVSQALNEQGKQHLQEELGDLIFSVINLIRISGYEASAILESANSKFVRRFNRLELIAQEEKRNISKMALEDLETLWQVAKSQDSIKKED